jgi:hypothetical protein
MPVTIYLQNITRHRHHKNIKAEEVFTRFINSKYLVSLLIVSLHFVKENSGLILRRHK